MSLFHIAVVANTLTIMSVASGYTIERNVNDLSVDVIEELTGDKIFGTGNLHKPHWTRRALELDMSSPTRQYFMFERAEELRQQEDEYERTSAMAKYADLVFTPEYA